MTSVYQGSLRRAVIAFDRNLRRRLPEALDDSARQVISKYRAVVASWEGKPLFIQRKEQRAEIIGVRILVSGAHADKWVWIDFGTGEDGPTGQPYIIRPVRKKSLAFNVGYNAKTAAVAQSNVGDGTASGDRVYRQEVLHPGIKARRFTETFVEQARPDLMQAIRAAVEESKS